jgi:signal transduction histidine kinase
MSDQGATLGMERVTEQLVPYSSVPVPDQAQRAAIMGQLSGGILHEFNNILTVISGTIDILAHAVSDRPELAAITRLIDEAALRGVRLTSHLVAFERGQPPQYRVVDVGALLSDAARLLRPVLGDQIEVAVSSPEAPTLVVADPGLLMAAMLKLAIAARNAMRHGGRISMVVAGPRAGSGDEGAPADVVEIKVEAGAAAMTDQALVWETGDLATIEEMVRLSGGGITIDRHVHRVGFEIRLRRADIVNL